jgi:hypothetical protein
VARASCPWYFQIDHVSHTEMFGDSSRLRTGGPIDTAHEPIIVEHLYPILTALAATIQPPEDLGQLRVDRCLSTAKEPAYVEPTEESCAWCSRMEEKLEILGLTPWRSRHVISNQTHSFAMTSNTDSRRVPISFSAPKLLR